MVRDEGRHVGRSRRGGGRVREGAGVRAERRQAEESLGKEQRRGEMNRR